MDFASPKRAHLQVILVVWQNVELFFVSPLERTPSYALLPSWWERVESSRVLTVPTLPSYRIIRTWSSIVVPALMRYGMSLLSKLWQWRLCNHFLCLNTVLLVTRDMTRAWAKVVARCESHLVLVGIVTWITIDFRHFSFVSPSLRPYIPWV